MQVFNTLLNLFLPKIGPDFTTIDRYLSLGQIQTFSRRSKKPEIKQEENFLEEIYVCSQYDSQVDSLVERAKFGAETAICQDLAELIFEKTKDLPNPDWLTFAPSDPKRLLLRGYHLPQKIAQTLGKMKQIPVLSFFEKIKHTKAQTGLNRQERLSNLEAVFELKKNQDLAWEKVQTVWIIDDVVTTGSTLNELAKTLKTQEPHLKIYGLAATGN